MHTPSDRDTQLEQRLRALGTRDPRCAVSGMHRDGPLCPHRGSPQPRLLRAPAGGPGQVAGREPTRAGQEQRISNHRRPGAPLGRMADYAVRACSLLSPSWLSRLTRPT
jgi:hypothetical protein